MKLILIAFLLLGLAACRLQVELEQPAYAVDMSTSVELENMRNNFKKYIRCIPGHFRSIEQLSWQPDLTSRDMISIRVFENQTDAVWTYTEVFATHLPSEPLAQVFYKHTRLSRDTFLMQPYAFRDLNRMSIFRNEWKHPPYFEGVSLKELAPLPNCGLYIVAGENPCFKSLAPADTSCALPLGGGAHYSRMALDYFEDRIRLETVYFDRYKEYVGTANKGGTFYNRLSKADIADFYRTQQGQPKKQLLRLRRP